VLLQLGGATDRNVVNTDHPLSFRRAVGGKNAWSHQDNPLREPMWVLNDLEMNILCAGDADFIRIISPFDYHTLHHERRIFGAIDEEVYGRRQNTPGS
jgi:hypothetical protein